jgi:hypothetical protein
MDAPKWDRRRRRSTAAGRTPTSALLPFRLTSVLEFWIMTTAHLVLLAALALPACSSIGTDFELANAARVRNGMSRQQVIAVMGSEPTDVEGSDRGNLVWLYSTASVVSTHLQRVSFSLDENGRVYGIPKEGIGHSRWLNDD